MSKTTYVAIERGVCVVCGQTFNAGALVLERNVLGNSGVIGWELCSNDSKLHRLGFVALVECEIDMNVHESGTTIASNEVNRTGGVMHLARGFFVSIFETEVRPSVPCVYVPQGTLQKLKTLMHQVYS